ncbi:MAG: tetraacyldisaccharide 4'-kinase [Comamonas sp.]
MRALLPLAWLYGALTALRRQLYRRGLLRRWRAPVPVVVVGNVIAGGAGKTPVTIHLVQRLQALGWQPGVVSRGYGRAEGNPAPLPVAPDSTPAQVGDEPLLIARATGAPVVVCSRRADAVQALLRGHPACDVVICDDGLQHLALARDLEVVVFNRQGVGNGWLLPAGPLREPWPRACDFALYAGEPPPGLAQSAAGAWPVQRALADHAVNRHGERIPLAALAGRPVHAVAAIAYPGEFFAMLQARGLQLAATEARADHDGFAGYRWSGRRIPEAVLLCTEKDAAKLWAVEPEALAVPLVTAIAPAFAEAVHARLRSLTPLRPA